MAMNALPACEPETVESPLGFSTEAVAASSIGQSSIAVIVAVGKEIQDSTRSRSSIVHIPARVNLSPRDKMC